jgi:hypothetical protein
MSVGLLKVEKSALLENRLTRWWRGQVFEACGESLLASWGTMVALSSQQSSGALRRF